MLIYSLLHLAGFAVSAEDLRNLRQWKSKTPGHPEFGHTPGIETTTGPLGQGISNAIGMALGAKMLAARFNTPDFAIGDHKVYVLARDGDLQEGVQSEAASLAGHWGLGNLIVFYDDNRITIAGEAGLAMSEDAGRRYEAYGWAVQRIDGHDHRQNPRSAGEGNGADEKAESHRHPNPHRERRANETRYRRGARRPARRRGGRRDQEGLGLDRGELCGAGGGSGLLRAPGRGEPKAP